MLKSAGGDHSSYANAESGDVLKPENLEDYDNVTTPPPGTIANPEWTDSLEPGMYALIFEKYPDDLQYATSYVCSIDGEDVAVFPHSQGVTHMAAGSFTAQELGDGLDVIAYAYNAHGDVIGILDEFVPFEAP